MAQVGRSLMDQYRATVDTKRREHVFDPHGLRQPMRPLIAVARTFVSVAPILACSATRIMLRLDPQKPLGAVSTSGQFRIESQLNVHSRCSKGAIRRLRTTLMRFTPTRAGLLPAVDPCFQRSSTIRGSDGRAFDEGGLFARRVFQSCRRLHPVTSPR